jgi:hypothetical protein
VERVETSGGENSKANQGLLAFRRVVEALASRDRRAHISYRDSVLTRLLQPGLTRDSSITIVCSISLGIRFVLLAYAFVMWCPDTVRARVVCHYCFSNEDITHSTLEFAHSLQEAARIRSTESHRDDTASANTTPPPSPESQDSRSRASQRGAHSPWDDTMSVVTCSSWESGDTGTPSPCILTEESPSPLTHHHRHHRHRQHHQHVPSALRIEELTAAVASTSSRPVYEEYLSDSDEEPHLLPHNKQQGAKSKTDNDCDQEVPAMSVQATAKDISRLLPPSSLQVRPISVFLVLFPMLCFAFVRNRRFF